MTKEQEAIRLALDALDMAVSLGKPKHTRGREFDLYRQALDALTELENHTEDKLDMVEQEPVAWQQIATAPKDGTTILISGTYKWAPGIAPACPDITEPIVHQASYFAGRWQAISCYLAEPTHWMPLPNPPEPSDD